MKRIIILLFLFTIIVSSNSCLVFKPSARKMTRRALKAHKEYDAIIVPGIPFEAPSWDKVMELRVLWAKHLYDRGIAKNIITSGSSVYTPYVEAKIMAEYLAALGVPRDHIFIEENAEHSTENLWYGYKIAKHHGFTTVAVCSDPFQSKLLYRFAKRRMHKQIYFLPAIFDTLRTLPNAEPVINYKPLEVKNFIPISKRSSKWQRFMGTMGRHIDFKNKD